VRTALSVVVLLGLLGCTSRADAPSPPATQAAQEPSTPGEPLPRDCRGELRPVKSGVTAACIARRAIPVEAELPPGKEWYHTVTFRDSRWLVSIYGQGMRRGGYLIHVDPRTGRVLRVEPQK
jgi:hypothetical protein